jgi:hypothetical protein
MRFAVTALVATLACAGCALQAEDQEVAGDFAAGSVSKDAPSGVAVAKLPEWQRADTPGDAQKSATSGGTTVTKAHPSSPVPEPESSCMGQPCDPTPQPWEPDPLRKAMKK